MNNNIGQQGGGRLPNPCYRRSRTGSIVNPTALLNPDGVTTNTLASPRGASIAIVKVAETAVALVNKFVMVTPGIGPIVAPDKLFPVSTTVRLAP